jgi:hypothetical protein
VTIVDCFDTKWLIFQAVMWRPRVLAAARIVGAGLAGSWAIGLLVLVGHVAGEVSGPSTILALVVAAITAVLTGEPKLLCCCFTLLGACLQATRAVRQKWLRHCAASRKVPGSRPG